MTEDELTTTATTPTATARIESAFNDGDRAPYAVLVAECPYCDEEHSTTAPLTFGAASWLERPAPCSEGHGKSYVIDEADGAPIVLAMARYAEALRSRLGWELGAVSE